MNQLTLINSSELTDVITIQQISSYLTSETGEKSPIWSDWKIVFAKVSPQRARDQIRAERLSTEQRFVVKMWYLLGLDEKMRIVHGENVLNIVSIVNVDSRNEAHELVCVKEGS